MVVDQLPDNINGSVIYKIRGTTTNKHIVGVMDDGHVGLAGLQITSFWNAWNFCHEIPKWPKYVILRMRIRRLYFDCFEEIGT